MAINSTLFPEYRIKTLSVGDAAWLLETDIDTMLRYVDRGIIDALDIGSNGNIEFRREDVARLLAKLGA